MAPLDTLYPDEPPPLSPAVVPPDRLYDPHAAPPGGGQWASKKEHREFIERTTMSADEWRRYSNQARTGTN
jgi:hypothetical protein